MARAAALLDGKPAELLIDGDSYYFAGRGEAVRLPGSVPADTYLTAEALLAALGEPCDAAPLAAVLADGAACYAELALRRLGTA